MKKIIVLFLIMCMILPATAYAEVTETGALAGVTYTSNVYVEGTAVPGKEVTILFQKDGEVIYINQVQANKDGLYRLKFPLRQGITDCQLCVRDDAMQDITEQVTSAVVTNQIVSATLHVENWDDGKPYVDPGDYVKVTVDISNKYFEEGTKFTIVAVAYGADNTLLGCSAKNVMMSYDLQQTAAPDFSDFVLPAGTELVRVFAYNNLSQLIPLGKSAKISKPVSLYVVSHSQAASYPDTKYPQMGWGEFIGDYFVPSVTIHNVSRGGWSTYAFLHASKDATKGNMATLDCPDSNVWLLEVKNNLKAGDFVLISHGTNDYIQSGWDIKEGDNIIYSWMTSIEEYKNNLRTMILDVRSKNAIPLLATDTMQTGAANWTAKAKEYAVAMQEVAEELGVPFIDTMTPYEALYNENPEAFHNTYNLTEAGLLWYKENDHIGSYWTDKIEGYKDHGHYSKAGAELVTSLLVDGIEASASSLKFYLK